MLPGFAFRCGNSTVVTAPYITECAGTGLTWEAMEQLNTCKALQPNIGLIQRSAGAEAATKKAEFAAIGCKVLIPHHHDFLKADASAGLDVFEKELLTCVPDGRFIRPVHGQRIYL